MRPERGFKMKARAGQLLTDSLVAEIADLAGPDRRPAPMRWFDRAFLAMMGLNLATFVTANVGRAEVAARCLVHPASRSWFWTPRGDA